MASVKCGVVWGRNPHGKDQIQIPRHRSVVLSLPHFHLFAPAVQYSKKTIPTHSHPAPAGCELLQLQKSRVNLSSKPNRPDHQPEPIARPLLHTYYTASLHDNNRPLGPKTEKPETRHHHHSITNQPSRPTWEAPLRLTEAYPQKRRLLPTAPPPPRPGTGVSSVIGLMSGRII